MARSRTHLSRPAAAPLSALFLIAISAYPTSASSQNDPKSSAACPTAVDMSHLHLQGHWRAELQASGATLQLGPHPELAHSVRGTVQSGGTTTQVSGDVDDGDLTLEESINGTNISATWTGRVVDGSCGKEIRGSWTQSTSPDTPQPFVLRKQASWQ